MALFMDRVQLPQGQSHFEEAIYFLPVSCQKYLVLILSTSEGCKAELILKPPSGLNVGPLDWESSAITTRPLIHKGKSNFIYTRFVDNQKIFVGVNSFQSSITFHIETSLLIYSTNQMSGFYMKCNTRLKWVKVRAMEDVQL